MRRAFVTGGTGFIGLRLVEELRSRDVAVAALHRPTSDLTPLRSLGVELVEGDLHDTEALRRGMRGADTVFHVAALFRQAKFPDSEYRRVNLDGTRLCLEAARDCGVSYFLHCSTTGVTGHIANPPADESEPYGPLDAYQESKTEAEKLALSWFREGKIRGSAVRPTMVWGPRDHRMFKLFHGVARRRLPIVGDGLTWCHWVLVDDVARAFCLAAETPRSAGEVYIVGGERPVTLEHTMATIAAVYGVALLPFKVPVRPLQLAGSAVEALCRPFGIEPPLHRRRVDFFVKNRSFDTRKAREHLGFRPRHAFEDEVRIVAEWYRDHGWLGGRVAPAGRAEMMALVAQALHGAALAL